MLPIIAIGGGTVLFIVLIFSEVIAAGIVTAVNVVKNWIQTRRGE